MKSMIVAGIRYRFADGERLGSVADALITQTTGTAVDVHLTSETGEDQVLHLVPGTEVSLYLGAGQERQQASYDVTADGCFTLRALQVHHLASSGPGDSPTLDAAH